MTEQHHPLAIAAARLYAPLLVLFGFVLLSTWPAGAGSGLFAGLAFGLAVALHALVFGSVASQRAFPPVLMRAALVFGVCAAAFGVGFSRSAYAALVAEGGVFAITGAGVALVVATLFGRAPTMREGAGS